jgi:hypothetical protein
LATFGIILFQFFQFPKRFFLSVNTSLFLLTHCSTVTSERKMVVYIHAFSI